MSTGGLRAHYARPAGAAASPEMPEVPALRGVTEALS